MSFDRFDLPFTILEVKCLARDRIELPPFQGSTLRGALGVALKRVCCTLRRQSCETCPLQVSCVYVYFFETPLLASGPDGARYRRAPHPFVFRVDVNREPLVIQPGETLTFGLTVMGRALNWLPYVAAAIEQMRRIGIGRGRGTFELVRISSVDPAGSVLEVIYEDGSLRFPERPLSLKSLKINDRSPSNRFSIHFVTPLRLRYRQKLVDKPDFHIIIGNLLQRVHLLCRIHGDAPDAYPEVEEMLTMARDVTIVDMRARWYDWQRYSHRQRQKMRLGGIIGSVTYEGDPTPFEPYLTAGSVLHIGKNTGFGLGRYTWEYA
ncbi:CRISPR system precrRNA processing endoribonuclease RAMP protein Cas6 [Thermodesulforhabdus norvegica]|uniref:CRISPR-associated endoribonuclease Cas6 n=1 Tax=Thermodesulforhabdus norvegica TaxID=39841 RepID=A0A1I4TB62_9BACT|nr:CRISPR system precrRNA processing endoribonuclease RAMP protein Cas6 [Thermodesulforhabdus norvegica]SFM73895.1 CRISPR-associated endoribonuclease Cas6 [Thermodesulforhabdus norvegica]